MLHAKLTLARLACPRSTGIPRCFTSHLNRTYHRREVMPSAHSLRDESSKQGVCNAARHAINLIHLMIKRILSRKDRSLRPTPSQERRVQVPRPYMSPCFAVALAHRKLDEKISHNDDRAPGRTSAMGLLLNVLPVRGSTSRLTSSYPSICWPPNQAHSTGLSDMSALHSSRLPPCLHW